MITKDKISFTVLTGVLLILSFPPFEHPYLAYVAFVPFLIAIDDLTAKQSFVLGFLFAFIFGLGKIFWISRFHFLALPAILLAWSIMFAVKVFIYKFISDRLFFISIFLFPFVFTAGEYMRASGYWAFPWGILGYSQYNFNILIQMAEITGVFGVSFLVYLSNTALAFLIISRFTFNKIFIEVFVAIILFFVIFLYGYDAQNKLDFEDGSISVGLVQPNFDSWANWWDTKEMRKEVIYNLTLQLAYENPEIIVWPESALLEPFIKYDNIEEKYYLYGNEWIDFFQKIFARYSGHIIFGTNYFDGNNFYNSAFIINNNLQILGRYDKIHLVPFGETLPFINKSRFVQWLAGLVGTSHFNPGRNYKIFRVNDNRIAIIICYEDVFGNLTRKFVKSGADVLINLTNIGWAESPTPPLQQNAKAIFRAVENRVPIFRSTNTGYTTVINYQGLVENAASIDQETFLLESSRMNKTYRTFYTRYGDLFANFVLLSVLIVLIISVFKPT